MPDESCRRCGGLQITCALCAQCRKEIKRICLKCGFATPEQFHYSCFCCIEEYQVCSTRHMEQMI